MVVREAKRFDDYCNVCGAHGVFLLKARDGRSICSTCAVCPEHLCEICGSTRTCDTPPEQQLHYEEECFK